MKISEKRISDGFWSYVFFFILIEPAAFKHYALVNRIYSVLIVAVFFVIFALFINKRTGFALKKRRMLCLLTAYYCYLSVVTIFNGGMIGDVMSQAVHFIAFAAYVDIVMKNNPKAMYRACLNILTMYVVINCVILFIFPDGLYSTTYFENNYFLGFDNQNINFILPALVLVLLKHHYDRPCLGQIIFTYATAVVSIVKVWSGMSLVVVVSMSIFTVFFLRRKRGFFTGKVLNGKILNFFTLLAVNVSACVLLVFFNVIQFFEYLIVDVLGKTLTLTGRTILWGRTIPFIVKNPIFGYGKEEYAKRAVKMGYQPDSPKGLHAHNRFMETMYRGGIILFAIYAYMLFYVGKSLRPVRESFLAKIISFALFIYLMGMLTEFYDYCLFFWGFMVMAENAEDYLRSRRSYV